MDNCIICDLIAKKKPAVFVYEDENFVAFLDTKPLFFGHCLLAPKLHYQTIYDLPIQQGNSLLQTLQKIGNAIKHAMHAEGTFIANNNTVSQSINHLHIHIVPRNKGDGLKGFFWPRKKYESEKQILAIQLAIKKEIQK